MFNFLYLLVGVAMLTTGGESLIKGSLSAAQKLRVSPLLVGLIIVGFGTSAPELVVSVEAAISQRPDIAVGNVIGSNISNVLLILGICTLIAPLSVSPMALRRDASMVVIATLLLVLLTWGGVLIRLYGLVLLLTLISYLVVAYSSERFYNAPSAELRLAEASEVSTTPKSWFLIVLLLVTGLFLLIVGSQVLLKGAIGIAEYFSVSEAVIGLTLVAVGTSLPELSISVIAAIRGHADVAVGNVLGSNIFNLLGILGVSALLQPLPIHTRILSFDLWVMLGVAVLLFIFLNTAGRLSRWEGGVFLLAYGVYLGLSLFVIDS